VPVDPPRPEGGKKLFFCLKVNDFIRELEMIYTQDWRRICDKRNLRE
jgi:hypothetical protein